MSDVPTPNEPQQKKPSFWSAITKTAKSDISDYVKDLRKSVFRSSSGSELMYRILIWA